ncbi:MAG: hypothetical protein DME66_03385 [Verrucomicrobia bacterium]|nr:MAG: hypothetical protein DME66_03385 [Verrucomicrobiota bacterium]
MGIGESKERTERSLIQSFDLVSGNGRLPCNSSSGQKLPFALGLVVEEVSRQEKIFFVLNLAHRHTSVKRLLNRY